MLALIKKIYFRLASPLQRRIVAEFEKSFADTRAEQSELADSLRVLQAEFEILKRHVDDQKIYIRQLQDADLHGLLAQHASSEMRAPLLVVDALADVFAGMEPSAASLKHRIPADELISWMKSFKSRCVSNQLLNSSSLDRKPDNVDEPEIVALCERQLEFNTRVYRDREAAASREVARLVAELDLGRHAMDRIAPAK